MTLAFKPMLASPADLNNLRFPLLASPKLDGIRAVVINGVLMSRSLKPIPNKHVQKLFGAYEHFDGELIVGEPTAKNCFNVTTSGVMSVDGEPDVRFYVFDHVADHTSRYSLRAKRLKAANKAKRLVLVPQTLVNSVEELLALEEKCLNEGYEGLILRDPDAGYKFGRSTAKEGILLKLKRFQDDEARIVGLVEQMHNGNEATTNELGRTKRSSHKENKTGKNMLGAFQVLWKGVEFEIGTGMNDVTRAQLWANYTGKEVRYSAVVFDESDQRYVQKDIAVKPNGPSCIGKLVKFKYFPVGVKDKPRHPVFLSFRDERDL